MCVCVCVSVCLSVCVCVCTCARGNTCSCSFVRKFPKPRIQFFFSQPRTWLIHASSTASYIRQTCVDDFALVSRPNSHFLGKEGRVNLSSLLRKGGQSELIT